jgi:PAS domain S-box-containing protein
MGNQKLCEIVGYSHEELLELTFQDITHPDDLNTDLAYYRRTLSNEIQTYSMEKRYIRQDASHVWVNLTVSLVHAPTGEPNYFIAVVEDISGRKLAEDALHKANQALQASLKDLANIKFALDQSSIVAITDSTGKINYVNDKFCEISKYSAAELLGQNHRIINSGYHSKEFFQKIWATISSGQVWQGEIKNRAKDGTFYWVDTTIVPFLSAEGKPYQYVAIRSDITERKQAEEQIKESLKEKEVLLKEIHHRVKNNLQIISSLLNLQSSSIEEQRILEILKACESRVASMALIHEQLYQSTDLARIDLAEYVENLTANLLNSYELHSQQVALKIDVENIFLSINTAIPCGLIINELVSNSLKYAFSSGSPGEIHIKIHVKNGNQIMLVVSDNGIGLSQDFDFQNTETLGLQLVTALTTQLRGSIKVERDNGTKFEIIFQNKDL